MGCDLSVSVWFSKFTEPDVLVKHMMVMLLQNFRVTDAIQKVAESYKCKPIEGKLSRILLHWPHFSLHVAHFMFPAVSLLCFNTDGWVTWKASGL